MIEFIKSANRLEDFPDVNNEICFIGKSNVGKSSLINALFGKCAYVGKTPGMTKMLNFFILDNKLSVVDCPGYGYARRNNEKIIDFGSMMESYFNKRKGLKECFLILDIRRISDDDKDMIDYLSFNHIKTTLIFNKIDKLSNNELSNNIKHFSNILGFDISKCYFVSCLNNKNIDSIKDYIYYNYLLK